MQTMPRYSRSTGECFNGSLKESSSRKRVQRLRVVLHYGQLCRLKSIVVTDRTRMYLKRNTDCDWKSKGTACAWSDWMRDGRRWRPRKRR